MLLETWYMHCDVIHLTISFSREHSMIHLVDHLIIQHHIKNIYVMLYINIVLEQPRLISFLAESWQPQLRLTFDWPLSTLVIKSTIQYILYQVLAKFVILLWINSYIRMLVALKLKKLFFLHYHKTKLD